MFNQFKISLLAVCIGAIVTNSMADSHFRGGLVSVGTNTYYSQDDDDRHESDDNDDSYENKGNENEDNDDDNGKFPTTSTKAFSPSDSERLMNWAEQAYPEFFAPAPQPTQTIGTEWVYRAYPDTDTAVGVQNSDKVFVTGGVFGQFGDLVEVGTLTTLLPSIPPSTIVKQGRETYNINCSNSSCHGANPALNQNGIFAAKSAANIRNSINRNKGGMGFLSFLSNAELEDIANYLRDGI